MAESSEARAVALLEELRGKVAELTKRVERAEERVAKAEREAAQGGGEQ